MMLITDIAIYWFITGLTMLLPHVISAVFLEKRSHPILRFATGILLFSIIAFLNPILPVLSASPWSVLILRILPILFLLWTVKLSSGMYIYYFIWGLVFHYLGEQISGVLTALIHMKQDLPAMYTTKGIAYIIVVILEILILRGMRRCNIDILPWRQVLSAALISLSMIALNMAGFANAEEQNLFLFLFQLFSMIAVILALYMQVVVSDRTRRQNEAEFYHFLWRSSKKDFEMKKAYLDLINQKYHDMKHEIRALQQLDGKKRKDRLQELEAAVDGYQSLFHTGNDALDTILNDKQQECRQRKILLTCTAQGQQLDFIDIIDLHILLGNLIDNAIEAVGKLPESQRVIDFKLLADPQFLRIYEANYYDGNLQYSQERLVSTKGDNGIYHGFGTQSMRYIVDRYHGEMEIETEEQIFRLHIMIPVPSAGSDPAGN